MVSRSLFYKVEGSLRSLSPHGFQTARADPPMQQPASLQQQNMPTAPEQATLHTVPWYQTCADLPLVYSSPFRMANQRDQPARLHGQRHYRYLVMLPRSCRLWRWPWHRGDQSALLHGPAPFVLAVREVGDR